LVGKEEGLIKRYFHTYYPVFMAPPRIKIVFPIISSPPPSLPPSLPPFFQYAGFTGVRLGWTVVPKQLKYKDGSSVSNRQGRGGGKEGGREGGPEEVKEDGEEELHFFFRESKAARRAPFA
jgi:LL-diaminopimelate aminotransferase